MRQSQLSAALRSSREALVDLEGQLDSLLSALRGPGNALRASADRVSGATQVADAALARLSQVAEVAQGTHLGALARRR